MFCEVIPLRREGERLRPAAWPPMEFGELRMVLWGEREGALQRKCNVANLMQKAGITMQRVALVLIEPRVTHVLADGMVWAGTELHRDGSGTIVEVEQAWLVRPRAEGPPLPPFDWRQWMDDQSRSAASQTAAGSFGTVAGSTKST
ncbi:MAG: hypothetical protein U1C04_18965 [Hydrogenophaga sp.]|uniref:hypothetical protein n=1 Tax=Hydrogenophaga sp. TaxID=1904254 RepID=UPI002ABC5DB2|nr:hypothetical protein [Hydrogenophaga sp.]MDZ4282833.1 hypothetical protein [Hydrogenophaga sp.]